MLSRCKRDDTRGGSQAALLQFGFLKFQSAPLPNGGMTSVARLGPPSHLARSRADIHASRMAALGLHVAACIRSLCRLQMDNLAANTGAGRALVAARRLSIGMAGTGRCGVSRVKTTGPSFFERVGRCSFSSSRGNRVLCGSSRSNPREVRDHRRLGGNDRTDPDASLRRVPFVELRLEIHRCRRAATDESSADFHQP